MQRVGIGSLTARVLCADHNSSLSPLDAEALKLWDALEVIRTTPDVAPSVTKVSGPLLERWFLKHTIGTHLASRDRPIPTRWTDLLLGADWPPGWGLHGDNSEGLSFHHAEFNFDPIAVPEPRTHLFGVRFRFGGPIFTLNLSLPALADSDVHHPRSLEFFAMGDLANRRTIHLGWPSEGAPLVFVRGSERAAPPDPSEWKDDL